MLWRVNAMAALLLISSPIDAEELPDAELLEFLADWESEDGQWIDPTTLEQAIQLHDAAAREVEHND